MLRSSQLYPVLDWFIPEPMRLDEEQHFHARIFLISHLFGPPIGLAIFVYLYLAAGAFSFALGVLISLVTAFFAYPFVLRFRCPFPILACISLIQLTTIILYAAYNYGGVYSPFLAWCLVVPLLALFYLGNRGRWAILSVLAVGLAAFEVLFLIGHPFPSEVPLESLGGVGVFSSFGAAAFITIMSLYYANIFSLQSRRLESEVLSHLITERKLVLAKEEAESASRAKSEFLATMSHELRTPLNAIIGFSQVISGELFGPVGNQKYLSYVGDIEQSGQHLLRLINEILDLAKIESGKFTLEESEVGLAGLVREAVDLIRPLAQQGRIALQLRGDDPALRVRVDELRLRQILLNLLSNAVKFTDPGGRIEIAMKVGGAAGIAITVQDTGVGIAEQDIERVMQPFEQADNHLARNTGGTGLGLPLARELALLHGGDLQLTSVVGRGTCVTLTLPAARLVASSAALGSRERADPVAG